jgi:hypothetical protein
MLTSGAALIALMFAVPAQQPCTTSAPQVVDDIYKQVLERPADPASAGFSRALGSGQLTVREIVERVAQSPEHLARFVWQPLVGDVYRQALNRPPTPEEEQNAMRQLANRMPVRGLIARTAVGAASTEQEAVQLLYQRLLGRDPDPDGFRSNVALAQRQGIDAVLRSMMSSPEYRMRAQQPAVMREDLATYAPGVQVMYRHLLAREPDPEGFAAMTQLAAVYGLPEVAHRIASSREYMQRWGEQVVPGDSAVRFCGAAEAIDRRQAVPRRRFPSD